MTEIKRTLTGRRSSQPDIQNIPIRHMYGAMTGRWACGKSFKPEIKHIAWTGGSFPISPREVGKEEWDYSKKLYLEDLDTWRSFWREDWVPVDIRNIFWLRARCDAHATFREIEEGDKS